MRLELFLESHGPRAAARLPSGAPDPDRQTVPPPAAIPPPHCVPLSAEEGMAQHLKFRGGASAETVPQQLGACCAERRSDAGVIICWIRSMP